MKKTIFTIAGTHLKIEYKDGNSIPPSFERFKNNNQKSTDKTWSLESVGIDEVPLPSDTIRLKNKINLMKERFRFSNQSQADWREKRERLFCLLLQYPTLTEHLSFYFNDPVEINLKQRKIRHFYLKEYSNNAMPIFDSRLITFAYSQILALYKGMLLHCAGVVRKKEAYLFFAPSEGGKSTVAKLSKQHHILGDDIIAIRKIKKNFLAFSTPWNQKEFIRPSPSVRASIKGIFFLKKSGRIYFEPLRPEQALVRTVSGQIHFFLYTERPLVEKIFFSTADLFKNVPAYEMHFRKNADFWPLLDEIVNIEEPYVCADEHR